MTSPLDRIPLDPSDPNVRRVEVLRRALGSALSGLEKTLLARDAAELSGDQRRAKAYSAQINEILKRLDKEDVREALSRPLKEAYEAGADGQIVESIDTARLRALADLVVNPMKENLGNARSPLHYVAPKLLSEDERKQLIEVSLEGTARGWTTAQLAQALAERLPASRRLLRGEFDKGTTIKTEGGARVNAGRYAEMLARTTTYFAANQGTVDRANEDGIPCVRYTVAPGCHDFCLDLHNTIWALNDDAAEKYQVPLLEELPGGSVPSHPNCRCMLSPFTPRKADAGKLPTAPKDVLAKDGQSRREQQQAAQSAFKDRIDKAPEQYAPLLAESAARRGFSGTGIDVPDDLKGQAIPGLPPGKKEAFGDKRALAEDVFLKRHIDAGDVKSRKELRQIVADTLRAGRASAEKTEDGLLRYKGGGWSVEIDPKTGLVVKTDRRAS